MARLIMVSIKDKVTGEFLSPIYVHNQEEAARIFKYQLNNTDLWKDNADQFEMYEMAILDTSNGNLIGIEPDKTTGENIVLHPDMILKGIDILS